jgi:LuxR family transcriptional regulator, maltose regulon positive regulatory protein
MVARTPLVRRLQGAGEVPLVLVVAPAGYGKSTLLAQWADRDPRPFAWLTLEQEDNDPAQLLSSIASVLRSCGLAPPRASHRGVQQALLRSVESAERPFALVLDDLQVLTSKKSLDVLTAMIDHLPWGSQLALASRSEPAMPVGRLRAHRKVVELRPADLALASSEAAELLAGAGAALDRAKVESLVRRTDGWAAALYLAALSADRSDSLVGDFVRDEILAALPPAEIKFLTRAAVLERLSGPVCDDVLKRTGSARLLRDLARSNVPLVAAEGPDCYRLNETMSRVLRAELRHAEPEMECKLHRRAAAWFAGRGDTDSAARHAVAARDAALTGRILWPNALRYVAYGRNAAVRGWLEEFSDEDIAADPALSLVAAYSWLNRGDRNRAEHWTSAAARGLPCARQPSLAPSLEAGVSIMRAAIGAVGVQRMGQDAARAYAQFPDGSPWLAGCCFLRGVAAHLMGDPDAARAQLEEGARRGAVGAPSTQTLCLAQLSPIAFDAGDAAGAEALAVRARAQAERQGLSKYPGLALVYATSAALRAHRGRVDEAAVDLRRARDLAGALCDPVPWYEAEVRVTLARASLRLSDVVSARVLLSESSRALRSMAGRTVLHGWFDEAWAQAEAANGHGAGDRWSLTTAELRVLQFLPTHLSFPQVAARLNVSANTVKTHTRAIYRKLDSSSRAETVMRARAAGLVER